MIQRAKPLDKTLLAQLPALYSRVSAAGTQATGIPDLMRSGETQLVDSWIARVLVNDPTILVVLSSHNRQLNGAIICTQSGHTSWCWHMSSPDPGATREMAQIMFAWCRSRGITQQLSMTYRNPKAIMRRMPQEHIRDLWLLEL